MSIEKETIEDDKPWIPMSDPVDIKYLGKFGEECNEAGKMACRSIIQGLDEYDPKTGKLNRDCLADEIADVLANINLVIERFGLDRDRIEMVAILKKAFLFKMHNNIPEHKADSGSDEFSSTENEM